PEQVGLAPFDLRLESRAFGQPARFFERHFGEIDGDYFFPAELREQSRFVAAAAAQHHGVTGAGRALAGDAFQRRCGHAELEFVGAIAVDGVPESRVADRWEAAVHGASIPYARGGPSDGSSEPGRA